MKVELYDGTMLDFPDDTPPDVVQRTSKRMTFERKAAETNKRQAEFSARGATGGELMTSGVDPTEGNSFGKNALIGVGKAISDTGTGIKQLVNEGLDVVAPRSPTMSQLVTGEDPSRSAADRKAYSQTKAQDVPLMNTAGGVLGNVAGNIGVTLAPGGLLKGASVVAKGTQAAPVLANMGRAALVPRTIAGAGGAGAAYGAIQPVGTNDSRTGNTIIGGVAGAAIPAAVKGWQMAKAIAAPLHEGGQNQIVGQALQRAAGNDAGAVAKRLQDAAQPFVGPSPAGMPMRQTMGEIVPGSIPTVADVADNAGVSALQRTASAIDPTVTNEYTKRAIEQNAARVNALRDMAGTDGARDMFGAARDATAEALYQKAFKKGISQKAAARMQPEIERLLQNPAIEDAIPIAKRLAKYDGIDIADPQGSLRGLHYVKKALDDMLDKAKTTGVGKIEQSKIVQTKERLLGVMDKLSPAYGTARAEFQAASRPINQMDTAAELAAKSIAPLTDTLQPAAFARNLTDKTAQRATGFRGATLDGTMENAQMNMLTALREDLRRASATQTAGRGAGSDTVQKLAYSNLIDSAGVPTWLRSMAPAQVVGNVAARGADALYGRANKEMANKLAMALLDAEQAAMMMRSGAPANPMLARALRNVSTPAMLSTPGLINANKE